MFKRKPKNQTTPEVAFDACDYFTDEVFYQSVTKPLSKFLGFSE